MGTPSVALIVKDKTLFEDAPNVHERAYQGQNHI